MERLGKIRRSLGGSGGSKGVRRDQEEVSKGVKCEVNGFVFTDGKNSTGTKALAQHRGMGLYKVDNGFVQNQTMRVAEPNHTQQWVMRLGTRGLAQCLCAT